MAQTTMATETEVEGETTVSVPEEMEQALSQEASVEPEEQTPPSDSQEEPEGEVTPEAPVNKEQMESQELSPRGQKRFGKLLDKLKDRTVENSELKQALEERDGGLTPQQPVGTPQVPWGVAPWEQQPPFNIPQAGAELSPEDYARDVASAANQIVDVKLNALQTNLKRADLISKDREELEVSYSILNPSSSDYNPEVSKKVARLYIDAQKSNPDLRLKHFVGEIMSLHQAGQVQGKEEVTPKLIRQEAEAAVTPSGSSQRSKIADADWEQLSTDEKEQWLRENGAWD